MSVLQIPTARVFLPLLDPAPYKGAFGGRGSGKSHFFAERLVEDAQAERGLRSVCIREVQKSLKESAKRLIEDKVTALGLGQGFKVYNEVISTPGDGVITFQGMQDHTAESIKSLEGFKRAWVEEAHTLSSHSLALLRPTIRTDDAELWFSWNPTRKTDPVDALLRGSTPPTGAIVIRANWSDNPWFPKKLEQDRADDMRDRPDQYDHTWEGDYVKVSEGAYFAVGLTEARREGRIGNVARDPLMQVRAFWDIGGTGQRSDASAIWIAQFVGREIRVLDYHESRGQPLAYDVEWLRSNGWGKAFCILPHDGRTNDRVHDVSYESALQQAGFEAMSMERQGAGAAMQRVEAARRVFPRIWFNEATTETGRDTLGAYHERRDDKRNIGLGPEHDWASHGADAFGLMCVAYEEPQVKREERYRRPDAGPQAWMGA